MPAVMIITPLRVPHHLLLFGILAFSFRWSSVYRFALTCAFDPRVRLTLVAFGRSLGLLFPSGTPSQKETTWVRSIGAVCFLAVLWQA
jgi:hypothetical protein